MSRVSARQERTRHHSLRFPRENITSPPYSSFKVRDRVSQSAKLLVYKSRSSVFWRVNKITVSELNKNKCSPLKTALQLLFSPQITKDVQNDFPVLVGKLHISSVREQIPSTGRTSTTFGLASKNASLFCTLTFLPYSNHRRPTTNTCTKKMSTSFRLRTASCTPHHQRRPATREIPQLSGPINSFNRRKRAHRRGLRRLDADRAYSKEIGGRAKQTESLINRDLETCFHRRLQIVYTNKKYPIFRYLF